MCTLSKKKTHHISRFASHLIDQCKIATGSGRWIDFKHFAAIENNQWPNNQSKIKRILQSFCVRTDKHITNKMQLNHNSHRNCIIAPLLLLRFQCRPFFFSSFLWCKISCPQCAIINFHSAQWTMRLTNIRQFFSSSSIWMHHHWQHQLIDHRSDRLLCSGAQVFFVKMPFQVATCNSPIHKCYSFVVRLS